MLLQTKVIYLLWDFLPIKGTTHTEPESITVGYPKKAVCDSTSYGSTLALPSSS